MVMLDIKDGYASAPHPFLRRSLAVPYGFTNFYLMQSIVTVHLSYTRPTLLWLLERV